MLKMRRVGMTFHKKGHRSFVGSSSFCEGFFEITIVLQICSFLSRLGHLKWRFTKVYHFYDCFLSLVVLKLRYARMTIRKNSVGSSWYCEVLFFITTIFQVCNFSQLGDPKMTPHEGFPFSLSELCSNWLVGMTFCKNGCSKSHRREQAE
jgi:hypothetical protein